MSADCNSEDLSEVVEVVLAVDPAERRSLIDAIRLVTNGGQVRTVAVIERTLEQLQHGKHHHHRHLMQNRYTAKQVKTFRSFV